MPCHRGQFAGIPAFIQRKGDDGRTKFVAGEFNSYDEAKKYAADLVGQGNDGAFVVGEFNGVIGSTSSNSKMLSSLSENIVYDKSSYSMYGISICEKSIGFGTS